VILGESVWKVNSTTIGHDVFLYDYDKISNSIYTMIGYNTSDTVWMRMQVVNGSNSSEEFHFTFNLSSGFVHEERI